MLLQTEILGIFQLAIFSHSATLFFHAQFRRCSRCSLIDYTNFYILYLKVEHRNINLQMSKLFVNIWFKTNLEVLLFLYIINFAPTSLKSLKFDWAQELRQNIWSYTPNVCDIRWRYQHINLYMKHELKSKILLKTPN